MAVEGTLEITISGQISTLPPITPAINALYNWWVVGGGVTTVKYGYLYNWYAATDARNIAPTGWHIPTDDEFKILEIYIGMSPTDADLYNPRGTTESGELKETGFVHWDSPNTGATNEWGFDFLGGGCRTTGGGFYDIKQYGALWSSSDGWPSSDFAWERQFNYNSSQINRNGSLKWYGFSIRLIKDDSTLADMTGNDGKVYNSVNIGTQVWMNENLAETKYRNGDLITIVTDNSVWAALTTEARCAYNNDESNAFTSIGTANNIAPTGWHVPTQVDLLTLVNYYGWTIAGGKLKESGINNWNAPNTGADNESGFTALGVGERSYYDGTYSNIKNATLIVSSTLNGIYPYYMVLTATSANSSVMSSPELKSNGFTIRFIKDDSIDPGTMTDYDGNVYSTVKIGTQVWMASNFQGTHFTNGMLIPNITDNAEWAAMTSEAMCYYNNVLPVPIVPPPSGNPPSFEIYISEACSLTYQVFPLNFLSTSLVDELESGKLFYRRKFNGTLIFGSNSRVKDFDGVWHNRCDDWNLFWGFEQTDPCTRLYIQINKRVGGVVYPYWDGYFSTTDGKWDIDRQLFEITPTVNDEYSLILENTKIQYDILTGTAEVATNATDIAIPINQTYTHNHWLIDVMNYILDSMGMHSTTLSTDFFTAATNYVTGAANKLTKLTIAQKSDIKDPDATNPAHFPLGVISWDELMDILKGMFQVYWVYDHLTDTIHVEHISWFTSSDGLDLRTQALCQSTNKYSYVKEKMPKYEKFTWMEANDPYFVGVPIWYDSQCVDQDAETNSVETSLPVTTDIELIYNNDHRAAGESDKISEDGWVIFQNSGAGPTYSVDMELAIGGIDVKLNMHLSWFNLHSNYFRYNRVLIEGYINNIFTTFITAQKTRKQECSAIICNDYDPDDNITTELGETYFSGEKARVDRAEIHPSGEIKFSLLYGTHYITPAPIPPTKWVRIIMVPSEFTDHCTHFTAILSEAAPVGGLSIEFRYVVLAPGEGGGNVAICANAAGDDIWNIAEGLTSDSYDITLDCDIPSDGCIYYWHPGAGDIPGWTIIFIYDETCRC